MQPMTAGWCVRVSVFDDLVVSISERELAGRDLSEADKNLIRECARHLLSFVGTTPEPPPRSAESFGLEPQMQPVVDELRRRMAASQPEQSLNPIQVPFTRALTVIVTKDTGARQAEASLGALKDGRSQIIVAAASEMFFHRLRLAVAQDPALADQIAVFYNDGESIVPIGLRFEDELKWPVGFLHEGWELEVAIDKVRQRGAKP